MAELDHAHLADPAKFPLQFTETVKNLHCSIENVTKHIDKVLTKPCNDTVSKMNGLEEAKYHLTCLYSVSSLYWVYLRSKGVSAQNHGIKQQLDLIKQGMTKVKQLEDRTKAPRLNISTAERFIRSGLFELDNSKVQSKPPGNQEKLPNANDANDEENKGKAQESKPELQLVTNAETSRETSTVIDIKSSDDDDVVVREPLLKRHRRDVKT